MQRQGLADWFKTSLGQSLLRAEKDRVGKVLATLYGPTAVQFGWLGDSNFLESSQAVNRVALVPDRNFQSSELTIVGVPEAVPLEARSIGLVVLPHVLEFTADPHQVLREVSRVLVPEGHVVIIGFNPLSVWGLRRLLTAHGERAPWTGRFHQLSRVKDWLAVLGFETQSGSMVYYRPPLQSDALRQKLRLLEKVGDRWWPMAAASYILVARKREPGLTPLVPSWKRNKRLAPGLAEPVTKISK